MQRKSFPITVYAPIHCNIELWKVQRWNHEIEKTVIKIDQLDKLID